MAKFLNTKGRSVLAIGLCDRCQRKFPIEELFIDGDSPGLRVCRADWDALDPYKLAAPPEDDITLKFVRPEQPLDP